MGFQIIKTLFKQARPARMLLSVMGLAGLCACGLMGDMDGVLVRECVLPEAQAATLLGRWPILPIPLAVHGGSAWSAAEMAEVEAAAETWNRFFSGSLGVRIFDYGSPGNFRVSTAQRPPNSSLCAYGLIAGKQYTGNVVIYKQTAWPASLPGAIAITAVCRSPQQPLFKSYMGLLELNYQNFFVDGQKLPDLRSILIHELGHLLGLDHSCLPGDGKNGFPSCQGADVEPDFLSAVMYPTVNFVDRIGESRRSLNANDQGRANCLYYDIAPDFGGFSNGAAESY